MGNVIALLRCNSDNLLLLRGVGHGC
jgi:hypothetical protein